MNLKITLMELKRLKKNIIIGLVSPVAYAALIMVFYIAFADIMEDITGMFENASIQGLLRAFSMDSNTFSYILNFYVAYSGVYVLIMGVIFASILTVHLFSKELKDGTYEFLYGNPISRTKIFVSKAMVVVIYLVILNLAIFLVGFTSIEILKEKSPLIPWMSEDNQSLMIGKVEMKQEEISNVFSLDEQLFYDLLYSDIQSQFTMMQSENDFDSDVVSELMTIFILDPDAIYDELLSNIDKYIKLFNIEASGKDQLVKIIELEKANYFYAKENFSKNSDISLKFFIDNPEPFLNQLIDLGNIDEFKNVFGFTDKEIDRIFIYYSLHNFIELSIITFLVMLSISIFVMMLSIVVPKGRFTTGMATGVCMLLYMISIMSNIIEQTKMLKYITPLSYLNMDVMAINYETETWALISIFGIVLVSLIISVVAFKKSDYIS